MNSISRTTVSVLLALCIVGGALYLAVKTDKIPEVKKSPLPEKIEPWVSPWGPANASDQKHDGGIITDQPISNKTASQSDGSIVKCIEGGKVTYSNTGCKDSAAAKEVTMNHAAGIVSPTRETVNETLIRMRAERAAEDRKSDVMAAQSQAIRRQNEQNKADTCAALNEQIKSLDAMARGNSTDWIRDERYKARNRQFELHC